MPIERPIPARTTVRIPTASGDELEAWLYLPEGPGPHPAVVMAHGIGAIKAGALGRFAERFRREGFAAVVFDYRQWGGSDGEPREVLSFPRQRDDYRTVIGWAAAHPDIDARRVFAWGTSFSGMYIVELAASDSRLAAAIGQSPLVDGCAAWTLASAPRWPRSTPPSASPNRPSVASCIAAAAATTTSTRAAGASTTCCASRSNSSTGTDRETAATPEVDRQGIQTVQRKYDRGDTDFPTGASDVTQHGLAAAWDAARRCRLLRLRQFVPTGCENPESGCEKRERGLGHVQHELRRRPVLTLERDQRGERAKPPTALPGQAGRRGHAAREPRGGRGHAVHHDRALDCGARRHDLQADLALRRSPREGGRVGGESRRGVPRRAGVPRDAGRPSGGVALGFGARPLERQGR